MLWGRGNQEKNLEAVRQGKNLIGTLLEKTFTQHLSR